jgi:hypothetical protein
MEPRLVETEIRRGPIVSPSWTDWRFKLQKYVLIVVSHGCITIIMLNGFSFTAFVAVGSEGFETLVSCGRLLRDFWVECSSLTQISFHYPSVGIALGYGLDDRGSRVRFPAGAGNFSLHHRFQDGSGAHQASYPMGTRGSFPGGKAAGVWSWPPTFIYCRGQRMRGAIPPVPQYAFIACCLVKRRDNFTFTLTEYLMFLFYFYVQ